MAVPGSGTLTIQGLHNEKNEDNYDASTVPSGPVTLKDLAEGGNSGGSTVSYEATNTTGDYEPDASTPHAMNEWYNYDHDHDPSTATTPTISLSSADLNSLTLTWDMAGVNQRVYFVLVSLWGSTLNAPLEVNGNTYKTSAGSTDLMQSGAPSTYNNGNSTIPASGYPNSTIVIKARAYYNGAYSAYSSNVTGVTRPATPTSLAASSITTGGMTIGWTAPTNGANSYTYYFGTNSTVTSNSPASTTNTSVAITGLSPNTTYYFAVEAVGTGGTGAITSTVSQITQLGTPTNLHQDSNTDTQIVLDWDAPGGGATSYTVVIGEVNDVTDSNNTTHTGITNTTYTKTGLESFHTYYYFVKSIGTGTAPDSAFSSADTVYTKPGVPTSLTTTSIGTGGMTIGWTAPTNGVNNYTFYFGTNSTHVANPTGTTTNLSEAQASLSANTQYYWAVQSNSLFGGSSTAVTSNSYTKPNQVSNLAAATVSNSPDSIDVSWNAPNPGGASNYILKSVKSNPYSTMSTFSTQASTSDTITGLDSNSIYYVGVVSVGPTSLEGTIRKTSDGGAVVGAWTTPDVPTSLGFSSISTSGLTFSWTAPSGTITGYTYYFIINSNISSLGGTATSNSDTDVDITGLASNTRYAAAVQAINTNGAGNGPIASLITGYTQVAAPTNLGTGTVQETSIQFTWSDGTTGTGVAPSGYNIKINYANNTGVAAIDAGNNTSYTKTGLTQGQVYYFWVEARGDGPVSGYVAGGAVYTLPAAPANFSIGSVTTTSITLSWDAVAGASSYTYYVGTSSSAAASNPTTGHGSTSVTISGLQTNQRYYATVGAVNNQGAGSLATMQDVYTKVGTPTSPTFTPNAGTPVNAPLSWTAPSDGNAPSSYYVRFGTYSSDPDHAANNSLSPNNVGNTTSHNIGSLTAGGSYYFWVKAVGDGSDSDYTTRLDIQLLPAAPTSQAVTPNSATQVTLSWAAGAGAATYNYWFGTNSTYTNNTKTTGETGTSVAKTGLTQNTRYYLRVESVNATGTTLASTTVNNYTNTSNVANVTAAGASASSITVSYTKPAGDQNGGTIVLMVSGDGANGTYNTGVNDGAAASNSLTQTGLDANKQYYFIIRNYSGNGSYSEYASYTNAYTFPDSPESLSLTGITDDDMTLNFSAPSDNGANSYIYYFGTNSSGTSNTATAVANTNSITKSSLASLTTHYFTVVAVGTGGNSVAATTINASTLIGQVQNTNVIGVGVDTAELEWDEMGNAYGYVMYKHYSAATGTPSIVASITGASNTDYEYTGLASNTRYYLMMKAVDTAANQSSLFSVFKEAITRPGLVSNFTTNGVTINSANLQWTAPTGGDGDYVSGTISGYDVYVGDDNSGYNAGDNEDQNHTGTSPSLSLTGLDSGTQYYVYIRAANSSGTGAFTTQSTLAATFTTVTAIVWDPERGNSTTSNPTTWYNDTNGQSVNRTGGSGSTETYTFPIWRVNMTNHSGTSTVQGNDADFEIRKSGSNNTTTKDWETATTSQNVTAQGHDSVYFQVRRDITYPSMGSYSDSINVTITNSGQSVTIPFTINYAVSGGGRSDRRLKTDIKKIGTSPSGIPIFEFRFKDDLDTLWEGTIAQDLLKMGMDEVVGTDEDGFYTVDYDKIDVDQIQVIEMDKK